MKFSDFKKWVNHIRASQREYSWKKAIVSQRAFEKDRREANIVRLVHSIEKGLSIANPRPGFGYDKIKTIYSWVMLHLESEEAASDCVLMARDAIGEYCDFHDNMGYASEKFDEIKQLHIELCNKLAATEKKYGGTKVVSPKETLLDREAVDQFFTTRHSVREFEKGPVDEDLLKHAIELAQYAPSACNRQAVRVYAIDCQKYIRDMETDLGGVGGFAEDVDKFLLICGKESAYTEHEYKQFVVSAAMFAGYLSMSLHGLGIGACVIQRSLRHNLQWERFCKINNIPADEQIVCMIGVGKMKDTVRVPISNRYPVEKIFRTLD